MLWRWIRGGITVEGLNSLAGFLGLGNPIGWIVTILLSAGAIVVGWLVAARTWAEGVLAPYGTFGYVSVILTIAILILIVIWSAALCYERLWLARSARRMTVASYYGRPSESVDQDDNDISPQYTTLLAFFLDHLEPVTSAQWSLQEEVLSVGVHNDKVRALATQSLTNSVFYNSFSLVAGRLACSPSQRPTFDELIISIHNAEFNYLEFIDGTDALASSLGVALKSDERLFLLWEDWRIKHNELVTAYEDIKRDPRFGILFRPLRENRWGKIIPPQTSPNGGGSWAPRLAAIEHDIRSLRKDIDALGVRISETMMKIEMLNSNIHDLPRMRNLEEVRGDIKELKGMVGQLPTWKGVIWFFVVIGLVASLPTWPDIIEALSTAVNQSSPAANNRTTPDSLGKL